MLYQIHFIKLISCASNFTESDFTNEQSLIKDHQAEKEYFLFFENLLTKDNIAFMKTKYNDMYEECKTSLSTTPVNNMVMEYMMNNEQKDCFKCCYQMHDVYTVVRLLLKTLVSKAQLLLGLRYDLTSFHMLIKTPQLNKKSKNKFLKQERGLIYEHSYTNWCFFQMKYNIMNLIYTSHNFHALCKEHYKKDSIEKIMPEILTFDLFINRLLMHFLEIFVLSYNFMLSNESDFLKHMLPCFTFNWTATAFFKQIEEKLFVEDGKFTDHNLCEKSNKLSIVGKFIEEKNTKTDVFFSQVYVQWAALARHLGPKIKSKTLQNFYLTHQHHNIELDFTQVLSYKTWVSFELNRHKTLTAKYREKENPKYTPTDTFLITQSDNLEQESDVVGNVAMKQINNLNLIPKKEKQNKIHNTIVLYSIFIKLNYVIFDLKLKM